MLNKTNDSEIQQRSEIHEMQSKAVLTTQNEIDSLNQMRYRNLLDDQEYLREKKNLQGKLAKPKEELGDTEHRAENWLELTEKTLEFISYAAENYKREDFPSEIRSELEPA